MLLKRWEPFAELSHMGREIDWLRRGVMRPYRLWPRFWTEDGHVDIDVYHTDDALVVKAAIPGVKPEDVEVSLMENALTIKGETKAEEGVKEDKLLHHERRYGTFRLAG